jgi:hypothetical protein
MYQILHPMKLSRQEMKTEHVAGFRTAPLHLRNIHGFLTAGRTFESNWGLMQKRKRRNEMEPEINLVEI